MHTLAFPTGDGEEQLQLVHVADAVRIGLTTTFDYVEGSDDDSVWPGRGSVY